jgi:hypothetical protein
MDTRAAIDQLEAELGVEVHLWCWSDERNESVWVIAHEDGLRVTDGGETHQLLWFDDAAPDGTAAGELCSPFGVAVVRNEGDDGYELEKLVPPEGDLRQAVIDVLAAQNALNAAAEKRLADSDAPPA